MKCSDLAPILTRSPSCVEVDGGVRLTTDCLYPSSDPVHVFVSEQLHGFRITDGGGAWASAQRAGRASESMFDRACRRYSVESHNGILVTKLLRSEVDWMRPAILAIANSSAMAARMAIETYDRSEKSLNSEIYEIISRHIPKHRIARNYEYRGRSGHLWEIDFAVMRAETMLIKSVIQNGNSINSNYAAFGDIGDNSDVAKFSVYSDELKQDSSALLRQVAALVPLKALEFTILNGA